MSRYWGLHFAVCFVLVAGCAGGVTENRAAAKGAILSSARGLGAGVDEIWVIERRGGAGGDEEPLGGELRARVDGESKEIPLPLEHTDVKGRLTVHVGSVRVRQRYHNPYDAKIEAVYVFPLPQNAAVSDFVMQIGKRRIRGIIREREEARAIYEAARRAGHVASLLGQERPNIFLQSVANIEPGKTIDIEITYFQTLRYEDGAYEFVLPMVVGPRFNPPGTKDGVGAVARGRSGSSGQKTEVSYLRPREISSHLISLTLDIDLGCEIGELESPSHRIEVDWRGRRHARVTLEESERIPNRDFVLRYRVAGDKVYGTVAAHGGYFTLVIQPPRRIDDVARPPREMVFVVDCSGSMSGEPLSACKRAIRRCLRRLDRNDTFQVIRFADRASTMGDRPVAATPANLRRGLRYTDGLRANGGTMMMTGIRAAFAMSGDSERRRIVSFMTDGYIGNEADILREVRARVGTARIFSFGVGNAVNRYLLERMARIGRGVATYVGTDESSARAVDTLYRRIEQPAMTDVAIDWGGLEVRDVIPGTLPDLFVGRPIVLTGRCAGEGKATVRVRGRIGGRKSEIAVPVDLGRATGTDALAKVWARARIAVLHDRMASSAAPHDGLAAEILETALSHGLVSDYTSFIAVDSSRRTKGKEGTTVPVPVPVPAGVKYETTVK